MTTATVATRARLPPSHGIGSTGAGEVSGAQGQYQSGDRRGDRPLRARREDEAREGDGGGAQDLPRDELEK